MNAKQAKKARKLSGYHPSDKNEHVVGRQSVWGKLPNIKLADGTYDPVIVDKDRLNKALDKTDNPKFKGQGINNKLRYSPGIPTKLKENCARALYKKLKKEFIVA